MGAFDLSGKVAAVTGGNGGIGLAMAEGLARAGASIMVIGRNTDKNNAAEGKLTRSEERRVGQECRYRWAR